MRISTALTLLLLLYETEMVITTIVTDETESAESNESTEATDSFESSSSSSSSSSSATTESDRSQLANPFQFDFETSTRPPNETHVNALSLVLKNTIHQIRQKYKKIDVVFLLDASSSVGKNSFLSELKFVRKFLSDFNVSYNYTRVSLVTYSSQGKIFRYVDHISEASEHNDKCKLLHDEMPNIIFTGGGTFTAGALKEAREILSKARRHAKKLICLITDGFSNGQDPLPIAEKLKSDNVTIISFGIQTGNHAELLNISSEPANEHTFLLDSFNQFESLARKALHTDYRMGTSSRLKNTSFCDALCEQPIANETTSCCDENADCTCSTISGHYSCVCKPGYYGTGMTDTCQLCPNGTYWQTWNLCRPCPDVNHIIVDMPATNSSFCVCKEGFVANAENRCKILQCAPLDAPKNGYFVMRSKICSRVLNSACGARCQPGYQLTGTSIRLCQLNGQWSGNETKCLMKNCPRLPIPYYGMATCRNDDLKLSYDYSPKNATFMETYDRDELRVTEIMPIDTDCHFKCGPGFTMAGSNHRTCLVLSKWDGLQTVCKQILCGALPPVPHGQYDPTDCTNPKLAYGTNCTLTCEPGYEVKGPSSKVCGGKKTGVWSHRNKQPKCVDVTPPELLCPESFSVAMADDSDYAVVRIFPPPNVTDNSDDEITYWMKPSVIADGAKLTMGDHTFHYVAIDAFKNKAKCNFTISVLDITAPIIENCVDPPEIYIPTSTTASSTRTFIDWDPPIIYDNSNTEVNVTQSLFAGHLGVGVHQVTYNAIDTAGNTNQCVMNITVLSLQCNQLSSPVNGKSLCVRNETHTWCELVCDFGYTMYDEVNGTLTVVCEHDVAKWPIETVGDCTKLELPETIEQVLSITLEDRFATMCDGANGSEHFKDEIETRLREQLCPTAPDCEIVSELPDCASIEANRGFGVNDESILNRTFYHVISRRDVTRAPMMKMRVYMKISKKLDLWDTNVSRADNIRRVKDELRTYDSNEQLRQKLAALKINVRHLNLEEVPLCRNGTVLKKNVCVQCPRGTFHIRAANACHWCPLGSFNDKAGQMECKSCPRYHSTRKIGAKSMEECAAQCPPGTMARLKTRPNQKMQNSLMPFCRRCLPGQYQPQYDQSRCLRCPPQHTSPRGSASSESCRPEPKHICQSNPAVCGPHGFCEQVPGNMYLYNCLCEEDFIGSHCERQLDLCASQPCHNDGKCNQINSTSFECQCGERFKGRLCENEFDICSVRSNCQNGGTCIETSDRKQICECPNGWVGDSCEIRQNFCENKPCESGECVSTGDGFLCLCPPGIIGRRCHLRPCDYFPCHKNAQCIDERVSPATRDNYRCQCPLGRKGFDCMQNDSPCDYDPCQNNGICVSTAFSVDDASDVNEDDFYEKFTCKCPPYFYGKNCEIFTTPDFVMEFTKPGVHNYVKLNGPTQDLRAVSFCTWLQTNDSMNYGTILSYATESSDNMLTLTDYNGFVLYVNGRNVITDITLNDGEWHFICVNWRSERGQYEIFIDGRLSDSGVNLSAGDVIGANGTLIVGQEQDSVGSSFSDTESFVGRISCMDLWNRTIASNEMFEYYTTCEPYRGNLYSWTDFRHKIVGSVKVSATPFCKPCPTTLHLANGFIRYLSNRAYYYCHQGYRLQGSNVRNCLRTSQWSLPVPYCRSIRCGYLPNLLNGAFYTEKSIHGETARYLCNENFRLIGDETRLCQANGTWSGKHPECLSAIECNRVVAPLNGHVVYANERGRIKGDQLRYPMGTFGEVQCENNTVLSGEGFLTCTESGTWDFSTPTCVRITTTTARTTTTKKQPVVTTTTTPKIRSTARKVRTTPKPTIRTTPRPTTRTTLRTTTRTTTTTARTTPKPTVRTSTTTKPPKTSTTPKYVHTTSTTQLPFIFDEIGTSPDKAFWQNWKNLLYVGCDHVNRSPFCDQIPNPKEYTDLSQFELPETNEYQQMDTKLLQRLTDARLVLQSSAVRSTLTIDNMLQLILYGKQYSNPREKLPKTMTDFIRIVLCLYIDTIQLDQNFKPNVKTRPNDDITQNLKNSLWQIASFAYQNYQKQQIAVETTTAIPMKAPNPVTASIPICDLKKLSDLPAGATLIRMASDDGKEVDDFANITLVTIGTVLHFNCSEGYQLIGGGDSQMTTTQCRDDTKWSRLSFECKAIVCDNPFQVNEMMFNTKLRSSEKYAFGQKLQLKCNDGFQLDGDAFIHCTADGKWSKVQSICTKIQCDEPTLPANASIVFGQIYARSYRDTIDIQCADKRFVKITCETSGQWLPASVC